MEGKGSHATTDWTMENNYVIAPTGDRLGWVSEGDETATDGAYDDDADAEMPPESSFLDVMTRVALLLMDIHRPTLPLNKDQTRRSSSR